MQTKNIVTVAMFATPNPKGDTPELTMVMHEGMPAPVGIRTEVVTWDYSVVERKVLSMFGFNEKSWNSLAENDRANRMHGVASSLTLDAACDHARPGEIFLNTLVSHE